MTRSSLVSICTAALLALTLAASGQAQPAGAQDPGAAPLAAGGAGMPVAPAEPPAVPNAAPVTEAKPDGAAGPEPAAIPEGIAAPPVLQDFAAPQAVPQPLPSPHDLSPMGMYAQADWVVKSVILVLLAACFLTWTVWLFKTVETFVARRRARGAARVLTRARSLAEAARSLSGRRDPAAFMAHAVLEEYKLSDPAIDPSGPDGVKERAASLVGRVEVQALARLRRGMGLLATVGSVAPFVGLFGTVWGIMNAFIGIAETQTTNLAVVAPGIAEALFATAIGLVAAIPAVVIYNHFTRAIASYKQVLGDAGAAVQRLLSRDIDFRHVTGA
ncbi:tonB-system energizer ExbB [Gemmobacter nectariphilus]|uniref:tonB-system energizer ExbB n=1 Tax=Gemmobacter nectariphilus TaxID=220343 RepID=UPI0004270B32|nr:tonB-system energizer ExbB [Gemmobacter nectariphilus]